MNGRENKLTDLRFLSVTIMGRKSSGVLNLLRDEGESEVLISLGPGRQIARS
jgi:hypothetical protein